MEQKKHIRIGQSIQTIGKCPRNGTHIHTRKNNRQSYGEPLKHTLRNHIKPLKQKLY